MLHALADRAIADDELLRLVSQIRRGPFHPLPEAALKKLKATEFGQAYLGILSQAKTLSLRKKLPPNQVETAHGLIRGNYFGSWIPNDFSEEVSESTIQTSMYMQLHNLILRVLDQISDDQKGVSSSETLSVGEVAKVAWAYWMHKAAVAFLSDLWILKEQDDGIYFEPTDAYRISLRRSVFSSTWDQLSRQAFESQVFQVITEATRGHISQSKSLELLPPELVAALAWQVLDRFYFLNQRFIEPDRNPLMPDALEVAKWLVTALIAKIFEAKFPVDMDLAGRLGLNWATLQGMLIHTKNNSVLDQGLILDEQIHFGNTSFEHVCHVYHGLVACQTTEKRGSEIIRQKVGDWFEHRYALELLKEDDVRQDYIVLPGHVSNNKMYKFDYDGILYNKSSGDIFFLQIKYRNKRTQYYWNDNFREFFGEVKPDLTLSESQFWKAIRQLRGVRKAINDGVLVQEQITTEFRKNKMVSPKLSVENCRFIVLHTAPAFDFVSVDGIVMYEFNTFRNLIKRGILGYEIFRNGAVNDHKIGQVLPIDQPDALIDILCTELDGRSRGVNNAYRWHQGLKVTTEMRFLMPHSVPRFRVLGKPIGYRAKPIWLPLT